MVLRFVSRCSITGWTTDMEKTNCTWRQGGYLNNFTEIKAT